jgi:hypothetical protein
MTPPRSLIFVLLDSESVPAQYGIGSVTAFDRHLKAQRRRGVVFPRRTARKETDKDSARD